MPQTAGSGGSAKRLGWTARAAYQGRANGEWAGRSVPRGVKHRAGEVLSHEEFTASQGGRAGRFRSRGAGQDRVGRRRRRWCGRWGDRMSRRLAAEGSLTRSQRLTGRVGSRVAGQGRHRSGMRQHGLRGRSDDDVFTTRRTRGRQGCGQEQGARQDGAGSGPGTRHTRDHETRTGAHEGCRSRFHS